MKKIFLLVLVGVLALSSFAADSAKQSILQFRLVVDKPTTNSETMTISETKSNGDKTSQDFQVLKTALLDFSAIKSADAIDQDGNFYISVEFTASGAKKIEQVTSQHIGERLAIVIDGKLISAPVINSPINSPRAQISGSFSQSQAKDIVNRIREAVRK